MSTVTSAIRHIGLTNLAKHFGYYPSAVQKWRDDGRLPKSDLAGLTSYADVIESLCGGKFTAKQLLADTRESWESIQAPRPSKRRIPKMRANA